MSHVHSEGFGLFSTEFFMLSSVLRQAVPAIPENDRVDKLAALDAAPRQEVDITAVSQKIETFSDDHEPSAPPTPRLAHKFFPLGVHRLFQIVSLKFSYFRYQSFPFTSVLVAAIR